MNQTTLHRFLLAGLIMRINSRDYILHWSQDWLHENVEVKQLMNELDDGQVAFSVLPRPLCQQCIQHFQ